MAAQNRAAGLVHLLRAALQNLFQVARIALARIGEDRERRDWPPAHRIDIAQRIGGGDRAEGVRVIDNRREEVDGLHQGELRASACTRRHRRQCQTQRAHSHRPNGARLPEPCPTTLDSAWTLNRPLSRGLSVFEFACGHSSRFEQGGEERGPLLLDLLYNSEMRRTPVFSAALLLAPGVHAGFPRAAVVNPRLEKASRGGRTQRMDSGAPRRHARRDRLSARLPAGARNQGQLQSHLRRDDARREEGLGILSQGRAMCSGRTSSSNTATN